MKFWFVCIEGVLFDLDGILFDSVLDFYIVFVCQCVEEGVVVLDYVVVCEVVLCGLWVILCCVFVDWGEFVIEVLVLCYFVLYEVLLVQDMYVFDGVEVLFVQFEVCGICWGVVINKLGFFIDVLLVCLGWDVCVVVVVFGDMLVVKKFDLVLVWFVCECVGIDLVYSVFVGDDRCDVIVGVVVGLYIVVVCWGYFDGGNLDDWQVDCVIDYLDEFSVWFLVEVLV